MGRHLYFFMQIEDEQDNLYLASELGDILLDDKGNVLSHAEIINPEIMRFYIVAPNSKITYSDNGFIDSYRSDVIEFKRSMIWTPNTMDLGRIWVELNYYDKLGNSMTKEKWLSDKFEKFRKIIKKNCRISKCKKFYVGDHAYKQYKNGSMRLMAGPTLEVEVD